MNAGILLLVLLAAALHATWNGFIKAGADKVLDVTTMFAGAAILTLLWIPFLPLPAQAAWPFLAASMVVHQVYFALLALSYRQGDMSLIYPITRGAAPGLIALASVSLLGEHAGPGRALGIGLVSAGILLLAFGRRIFSVALRRPVALALANAVMIALYTLIDGTGVRLSGNAISYISWGFLLGALGLVPAAIIRRGYRVVVQYVRSNWCMGLLGGACSILAYGLALWAMTRAPIALVAALRETSIVFALIIAGVKLKEPVGPRRIAAICVVLTGVAMIKFM